MLEQIIKDEYHLPSSMYQEIGEVAEQRDVPRSQIAIEALHLFLKNPTDIPRTIEGEKVRPSFYLPSSLDREIRLVAAEHRRKKSLVMVAALSSYLATQKIPISA